MCANNELISWHVNMYGFKEGLKNHYDGIRTKLMSIMPKYQGTLNTIIAVSHNFILHKALDQACSSMEVTSFQTNSHVENYITQTEPVFSKPLSALSQRDLVNNYSHRPSVNGLCLSTMLSG